MRFSITDYAAFAVMDAVWKMTPPRNDVSAHMDWLAVAKLEDLPFNAACNEIIRLIDDAKKRAAVEARDAVKAKAVPAALQSEAPASTAAEAPDKTLLGSDKFDALVDIGGVPVAIGDIVPAAQTASGMSPKEWNDAPQGDRDIFIQIEIDARRENVKKVAEQGPTTPAPTENAGA